VTGMPIRPARKEDAPSNLAHHYYWSPSRSL
jgi:hypothetical protein